MRTTHHKAVVGSSNNNIANVDVNRQETQNQNFDIQIDISMRSVSIKTKLSGSQLLFPPILTIDNVVYRGCGWHNLKD